VKFDDLREVNAAVNQFPYRSDPERYGKPEFWEVADAGGSDCEDFALAKLHRLLTLGWPISALRLATCWCFPNKEGYHAVLLADLEGQTWVLDNRHPHPMEYNMLPYEWDKVQVAGTMTWNNVA
jgi:predicted transglutaminase-like cysteine proteinase